MALDLPRIGTSNYTTSAYALNAGGTGYVDTSTTAAGQWTIGDSMGDVVRGNHDANLKSYRTSLLKVAQPVEFEMAEKNVSRFVRVIIVDPNENLSLEDRLVYKGEEKFTDLNDQELFFELEIKSLLSAHNEKRVKTVDKTVKERTEHLEPAKIRDLKMVVVNIATF